ncbi:MAG: cytidine deaminase [Oscillospiraceae bacterium]|nr:cytidine deaminase [Oscillospiraceae bacterium]
MNYRFMIDTAVDVIRKRYDKRHNPVVGDTVCVICSGNGTIYTAYNEYVQRDNGPENVHAEINAIKKMLADGQTKIKAVTVFNSCTVTPLLPCNGCIARILSLNPENYNTLVVTPNGNILLTDVSRFAAGPDLSQTRVSAGGYSVYTDIPDFNRGASLYMSPAVNHGPVYRPLNSVCSGPPLVLNRQVSQTKMPDMRADNQGNRQDLPSPVPENSPSETGTTPSLTGTTPSGNVPERPNQSGVNKILKNKLSALFEED